MTEVSGNRRERRRQGLRPRDRAAAGLGELEYQPSGPERRARALGWLSLGLGLVEVAAPGVLARGIGLRRGAVRTLTLAGLGLRELAVGIGLLASERPAGWMWARVAGDAVDLGLLGAAIMSGRNERQRAAAAAAAVAGITALDFWTALALGGDLRERLGYVHVTRTVTVNRPPDEVYRFWRDFENLPRFMAHLASVRVLDGRRSRWSATAPAGTTVEWEAELVDDRPNELVAWRSTDGLENSGLVHFAPALGSRGTEVCVEMTYAPPGGVVGAAAARLFGEEPAAQIEGDLRRFKQVMEVGEVVHSDSSVHRGMHPARPSAR